MKHLPCLVAALLASALPVRAADVVSNTASASTAEYVLDAVGKSAAQAFTTGPAEQALDRITVRLKNFNNGNSSARVKLWTSAAAATVPGVLVEDLGTVSVDDSHDRDYHIDSTIRPVLAANSRCWVSVTNDGGDFDWRNRSSAVGTGSGTFVDARADSSSGSTGSWNTFASTGDYQILAVTAYIPPPNPPIVVRNANASGADSLAEAVATAEATAGPDTITFEPGFFGLKRTITPTTALTLNSDVTIDARGFLNAPTISGGNLHEIFIVNAGQTVTLGGLVLTGGNSGSPGGAITNAGRLTIDRCTLTDNSVTGVSGGAIANSGSLTLTGCTLSGNSAAVAGGAIVNDGLLTLTHCTLSGNSAASGGGIVGGAGSSLTLTNTVVAGNTATGGAGNGPDVSNNGSLILSGVNIVQTTIAGNATSGAGTILEVNPQLAALGNYGGPMQTMPPLPGSPAIETGGGTSEALDQRGFTRAVDGDGDGTAQPDIGAVELQVRLVTTATDENDAPPITGAGTSLREALGDDSGHADIVRFTADFEGGILGLFAVGGQLVIDRNVTVDASSLGDGVTLAGDKDGYGNPKAADRILYVNPGWTVALHGLTLTGGLARDGGAIYNKGALTLTHCTLSGNTADYAVGGNGGGGAVESLGALTLRHCTLADNRAIGAAGYGGAIDSPPGSGGSVTLTHCTLSGNSAATEGGAIWLGTGSTLTLSNTIIAGNTSGSGPDVRNDGGTVIPVGANLIGSNDTVATEFPAGALVGTSASPLDPKLASLGSYGGPAQTVALLPGSPALGASLSSTATTDQRGFPIVATADLGAYESQGSTVTLTSSDNPTAPGESVTFTATVNELDPQTITPTGTVTFTVDSVSGSPVALNASGIATLTTSNLSATTHIISATYNGDARLLASTSSALSQSVLDLAVGNGNDSGTGSLRQALINAAAHPGPDTITLTSTRTVILTSELLINDSSGPVTIDATGLSGGFTLTDTGNVNRRLLHVASGSTLIVRGLKFNNGGGSTFTGNGGAILNEGTLTLDRCTVSSGEAQSGGGLYGAAGSTLTATSCTFGSNVANIGGGALYCDSGSVATLDRCMLGNNSGISAGALLIKGQATLTQCALLSNLGHTAATMLTELGSSVSMVHCTAAEGYASVLCSGLLVRGTLSLQHCVLGQNSGAATQPESLRIESGVTTLAGVSVIEKITGTVAGTAPIIAKPLLSNYGIPLPGSPAIDQAPVLNPALTSDLTGRPRPLGLRPDLGAIEGPIVVTTPVDELDPPGALGAGVSLREAVRDAPAGDTIGFDRAVFNGATTNTITLTRGPLNPQRYCTLDGSAVGIHIIYSPTVTAQPQSLSVMGNASASFNVAVTNVSGGVSYAWRKNGTANGATTSAFNIASAQESDEAVYDVELSEAASPGALGLIAVEMGVFSAISQPASLIVNGATLAVQRGPASAMLALGSNHTLSVVAIGPALPAPALTYQWKRNGATLSGATKSSYVITNAQLTHAGTYTCVVKSGVSSVPSTPAEIGVVDTRAKTVNVALGGSFTATVSAAGNGLTYLWSSGQTTQSFIIKPVAWGDANLYTCTVTGLAGQLANGGNTFLNITTAATSAPTIISYPLPQAYIGLPYSWQVPVQHLPGQEPTVFSIAGLPTGLSYSSTTGIITGRPTVTKPAGYPVTMKAGNARGYGTADVETLTVNALPNGSVGTFAGPLARSSLNDNLGGRFDLTTTATGMCSGSITLGARAKIPFTNQLLLSAGTGDVILRANIPGITMADKTVLTAYVEVFAADQRAVFTLVHPNGTTLITPAWRNPWLLSKTLALNNPATAYAAYYTARLDVGAVTNAPLGYGYTSFTVKTDGTLTLAGKLADGSAITGGTFVSKDGEILLFNLLYSNRGSQVGQFTISPSTPVTSNVLTGETTWFKPAPLPKSTDTVYQAGFGPISVGVQGAPYVAPGKGALVPGFIAVQAGSNNAKLNFTLGGLEVEGKLFTQLLRLYNPSASGVTNSPTIGKPLNYTTKLTTFTASSGALAGNYTIPGTPSSLNRLAPFYGQLVKIGATTQGYGYFLLPKVPVNAEKVTTSPKLSGRVVLGVP